MLLAHLPAGYLLHRVTHRLLPRWPLLIGSIAPDFDMALVWTGWLTTNHHHFLTHRPALWLLALGIALARRSRWAAALALGALLHLCLDSVSGSINWAWPFGDYILGLIQVPRQPGWWVWSFVAHPVFAIELTICAAALITFWQTNKKPRRLFA